MDRGGVESLFRKNKTSSWLWNITSGYTSCAALRGPRQIADNYGIVCCFITLGLPPQSNDYGLPITYVFVYSMTSHSPLTTRPSPRSALTNQIKVGKQRVGADILARNGCL